MNRIAFTLLTVALLLCASNTGAYADGCDDCGEPSLADLEAKDGFVLKQRLTGNPPPLSPISTDYYEVDAGDCFSAQLGNPEVRMLNAFLALRGKGEVWDCPHSISSDTIVAESRAEDSTGWEFSGTIELKMKSPAAEFKASVTNSVNGSSSITEVTRVEKKISAGWCRRMPWNAYFEVANFEVKGNFAFKQSFAWWTKNSATGDKVHAKGDITMDCGSATFILQRRAPISVYMHLTKRRCQSPECATIAAEDPTFHPPLPPYLKEPEPPPFPWGEDDEDGLPAEQPPK